MYSSSSAEKTGKPLWASEDDSTYDNAIGGECFARIINRNYVLGNMTSTINWCVYKRVHTCTRPYSPTGWWRHELSAPREGISCKC